jgi:CHAT domain-containing protein/tetratricopeptide (TPR) repeat protein
MFGLSRMRQWWRRNHFLGVYGAAMETRNVYERIAAAQVALDLADGLDPWPDSAGPKRGAVGKLHYMLGRAYTTFEDKESVSYSRMARGEFEKAVDYLTPDDGADWARAMIDLSIACASSREGNHVENIERAIEAAEAALKVLEPERDHDDWLNAVVNLAGYYVGRRRESNNENVERARRLYEAAFAQLGEAGTPVQRARLLIGLGECHLQRRIFDKEENVEQAIEYVEQGLALISPETSLKAWTVGHSTLAAAYLERVRGPKTDNLRRAVAANDECVAAFERAGMRERWAHAMMVRCTLLEHFRHTDGAAEQLREAVAAAEGALSVFTPEKYPEEHAEAVRTISRLRSMGFGDDRAAMLEEVIRNGEATLSSPSDRYDPTDRASTLVGLGNAYAERIEGDPAENMERSVKLLEEAVTLLDQRARPVQWAGAMNSLAQSYQERAEGLRADNIEKSLALCEAALVVVPHMSDPDEHSMLLETLGEGFANRVRGDRRENLDRAVEVFDLAARRRDREHEPEAWLRLEQKRLQADRVLSSLMTSETDGDNRPKLDVEQYLADLHASAEIVSVEEHPRTWMAAHLFLADTYTRVSPPGVDIGDVNAFVNAFRVNCQKALEIYEAALPVAERLGDKSQWALLKHRVGVANGLMYIFTDVQTDAAGEDPEPRAKYVELARGYYEAAVAAHSAALEVSTLEKSPHKYLEGTVTLGRLHVFERNWAAAEEMFAAAAKAADRLLGDVELSESDMSDVLRDFGQMASLAPFVSLMLDKPMRALELAESGRARLLAKALTLESLPMSPDLRQKLHDLQRKVATHERHLASPRLFDRRTPLEESMRLRREIRSLVEQNNLAGGIEGFAAPALESLLTDGSVVVIPVLTEAGGRIMICFGRGGKTETHIAECHEANALQTIFKSSGLKGDALQRRHLRSSRRGVTGEVLYEVGDALGEAFATPLVQALDSLGVGPGAHLDILPQGPLGLLPLGLARDGRSGQTLLERYELSLSPSLTALRHAKRRASIVPSSIVSLANPTLDLDFAQPESDFLRNWFRHDGATYMEGHAVSPEEILAALPGHDVWHFATHGGFNPRAPLKSFLMLGGDNLLTLEMLFETSGLGAPRLVVLSACETGLYDLGNLPDEFIGLPSGFLQAGAAGVIATLWPVYDLSTALLIGRFYEGFAGGGLKPPAALRAAQLWLRDASRDDVLDALSRWGEAGRVSSVEVLKDALERHMQERQTARGVTLADESDEAEVPTPFASPVYWGGFVHYGV